MCGIYVVVEFRVQEADDLTALIVANGLVLCVPEHWDCVPAFVRPVRREVEVTQVLRACEFLGLCRYLRGFRGFSGGCKVPTYSHERC